MRKGTLEQVRLYQVSTGAAASVNTILPFDAILRRIAMTTGFSMQNAADLGTYTQVAEVSLSSSLVGFASGSSQVLATLVHTFQQATANSSQANQFSDEFEMFRFIGTGQLIYLHVDAGTTATAGNFHCHATLFYERAE